MIKCNAIIKVFFLTLFLVQLISVCYQFECKSTSIKFADVSTEEGIGDFSTEDSEGEVGTEFYLIENKNSPSNDFISDVYQQTIYLSHNNQIPKPVYLEIPYSPPENKI
jgi:hypothetical protein